MVVQFIACHVAHLERNGLHTLSLLRFQSSIYAYPLILKTQPVFTLAAYGVYIEHCKAEAAQLNEEEGLPCTTCPMHAATQLSNTLLRLCFAGLPSN